MKKKGIRLYLIAAATIAVYMAVQLVPCLCSTSCSSEMETASSCCCDKSAETDGRTMQPLNDSENQDCCGQCGEKEQYEIASTSVQVPTLTETGVIETVSPISLSNQASTRLTSLASFRHKALPAYIQFESFLA